MSTFKNFVQCKVTTPIPAAADSIGLYAAVPPYSLPSEEGGLLVLTDSPAKPSKLEVISYTSRSALGLYGVTRGLEGTTAQVWTGPVYCYQSLLAGEFKTLLDSKEDKVHTHTTEQVTGLDTTLSGKADKTIKIYAGTGLTGGGSLEDNRTLSVNFGLTTNTAIRGNDPRVVNAASNDTVNAKEAALEAKKADKAITITAGTGLSGGGTLAANHTLSVTYGTTAGTAAQGNDSRITGALQTSQVVQVTGTSTTSVMSQKATTDQLATKAASLHTHPWSQVTGAPATATRWPTLAEVTGKPTSYPTNWATVSDKPIVQTVGTSTTDLMSQVAITEAINAATENIDVSGPRPIKDHGNVAVSTSQTVTCDVQEADFHIMSLATSNATGTLTINFSNMPDTLGKHFSWHVRLQRGARKTVAFAQTVNWSGGVAPTFGSGTTSQDLMLFYKVDSETIRGMVIDAW